MDGGQRGEKGENLNLDQRYTHYLLNKVNQHASATDIGLWVNRTKWRVPNQNHNIQIFSI